MAQPIYCDADGCTVPADIMISNLNNGSAQAFCYDHYSALILEMGAKMVQAETETGAAAEDVTTEEDEKQNDPGRAQSEGMTQGEPSGETGEGD